MAKEKKHTIMTSKRLTRNNTVRGQNLTKMANIENRTSRNLGLSNKEKTKARRVNTQTNINLHSQK